MRIVHKSISCLPTFPYIPLCLSTIYLFCLFFVKNEQHLGLHINPTGSMLLVTFGNYLKILTLSFSAKYMIQYIMCTNRVVLRLFHLSQNKCHYNFRADQTF